MKFDRNAPNEGVNTEIILENGKVLLTWQFRYCGQTESALLTLFLRDREGRIVLTCLRREPEEELLQAVLLRPRLWNGVQDPYIYKMEIFLQNPNGQLMDSIVIPLPLRSLRRQSDGAFYLNGVPFQPRTINYSLPESESPIKQQQVIFKDLQMVLELGANSICCNTAGPAYRQLFRLCDRTGILILPERGDYGLRDGEQRLLDPITGIPDALFYRCKARWSRQHFVYISPDSIRIEENGKYTVTVYSNCSRVALYADGILFSFQNGEYEFVFEQIPAEHPCITLTAEADDCNTTLTVHRSCVCRG